MQTTARLTIKLNILELDGSPPSLKTPLMKLVLPCRVVVSVSVMVSVGMVVSY
jgi:hypothetical protein